ncbi:MAG: glycoside hydrolase family 15 protein [Thermincola sp.]|jgi:oligosaccharide amylase|nr:glycoside hydrolase family 15 protein [Thermincola sp.]MDT3704160.1 glycoside hydrolase family 15 protein [Thermincola sp.]
MPRQLVVGNGKMLVNFDSDTNIRDLYFPYVGQSNHIQGNKNSIGVWVEGKFSWCDEAGWEKTLRYRKETLVTCVQMINKDFGLSLDISDAVHYEDCVYVKKLSIHNLIDRPREVRVFFTHDFTIDETEVGDTAVYEPQGNFLYHYKKSKYFLINGFSGSGGIFQYATGTKRFRGAEGTWRDAEDGKLEGNPIAQGSVDSTLSFRADLSSHGKDNVYYWLCVGKNFQEVQRLNRHILKIHPETMLESVEGYWRQWANKISYDGVNLSDEILGLYKRSLLIIRTQVDKEGAVTAANDSDILHYNRDHYSYCWPRDGALVAQAIMKAGYPEMVQNFFKFCENALTSRGFLMHKYNPDGSVGSSWHPWIVNGNPQLPVQEDETALVLFALWEYYQCTKDIEFVLALYRTFIRKAGSFLVKYMREELELPYESYDLWEERRGIFTFTASAVFAGLQAAANFAEMFADSPKAAAFKETAQKVRTSIITKLYDDSLNRFLRGIYVKDDGSVEKDLTLESSVFGVVKFGVLPADDQRVEATMKAIESGLWVKTDIGGIARYTNDNYFSKSSDIANVPGNPWFISTLWLAEWYIAKARSMEDLDKPKEILGWVIRNAMPSGILPEQIHPYTGEPMSVAPLTWSHAEYVLTVRMLIDKMTELSCSQVCNLPE